MKYAFMAEHIECFQVKTIARILGVACSGFYSWLARKGHVFACVQAPYQLDAPVSEAFAQAKGRSGAIRISKALAKQEICA